MTRKAGVVVWAFAISAGVCAVIAATWAIASGARRLVVLGLTVSGAVIGLLLVVLPLEILKLFVAVAGGLGLDEDGTHFRRVRAIVKWSDGLLDDV